MAYVADADLRARLGLETYVALFDDDDTFDRSVGTATTAMTAGVNSIIAGATARVNAWLPDTYSSTLPFNTSPPATPPELIRELTLMYAEALAWKRNPDYLVSQKMGPAVESLLKAADQMGQRIQDATLRMYDAPQPTPANVGGVVYSQGPRTIIDSIDGTKNSGDF